MSETASRRLFKVEFVFLALPALAFITFFAIGGGGIGLAYLGFLVGAGVFGLDGDIVLVLMPLFLAALAVWVSGVVGILIAAKVSFRFWKEGRAGLREERRLFALGLVCGAAPLLLLLVFGWSWKSGVSNLDAGLLINACGLALLPPILHLWLELQGMPEREAGA